MNKQLSMSPPVNGFTLVQSIALPVFDGNALSPAMKESILRAHVLKGVSNAITTAGKTSDYAVIGRNDYTRAIMAKTILASFTEKMVNAATLSSAITNSTTPFSVRAEVLFSQIANIALLTVELYAGATLLISETVGSGITTAVATEVRIILMNGATVTPTSFVQ